VNLLISDAGGYSVLTAGRPEDVRFSISKFEQENESNIKRTAP
jgi:hypothetical protein